QEGDPRYRASKTRSGVSKYFGDHRPCPAMSLPGHTTRRSSKHQVAPNIGLTCRENMWPAPRDPGFQVRQADPTCAPGGNGHLAGFQLCERGRKTGCPPPGEDDQISLKIDMRECRGCSQTNFRHEKAPP